MKSMTARRVTISLPEDVAERLEHEPNASAFIAEAVRQRIRVERIDVMLADAGLVITAEGRARARGRLTAAHAYMASPEAVRARSAWGTGLPTPGAADAA